MLITQTGKARCTKCAFQLGKAGLPILLLLLSFTLPLSLFSDAKLSEKSPFLPPGHGADTPEPTKPVIQPQGPISRELEFRGIVQIGGVFQFSIFNKKEQKGYWLKTKESEDGIAVNTYDANSSTIVVEMNGRSERLTLMAATDGPLPVAQAKQPSLNSARPPGLPPELNVKSSSNSTRRTVIRRRVVQPK